MRRRSTCTPRPASCASARCARWASSSAAGSTACSCKDRWDPGTLPPHRKDDFPLRLAAGEQLDCLGGALEGQGLRDVRLELALRVPAPELTHAFGEALGLAPREVAPEDAHDRCALEERKIERQLGNFAGGEADHQQPAAPRERAERGLAVGAADRIVN